MPIVFSNLLVSEAAPVNPTSILGAPVTGTKWIINDIQVANSVSGIQLVGFHLYDIFGTQIFGRVRPYLTEGGHYSWSGRQVMEFGDHLQFTHEGAWQIRVSGYILTLP